MNTAPCFGVGDYPVVTGRNVACYDNGGETYDRYTVVYLDYPHKNGKYDAVAMNDTPFHPLGFCQHVECENGDFLGKPISFADLPSDCRKVVERDLSE